MVLKLQNNKLMLSLKHLKIAAK